MSSLPDLHLCGNCLEGGAQTIEVGPDEGPQRDPERKTVELCPICRSALLVGDFATLADRQADTRTVRRPGLEP